MINVETKLVLLGTGTPNACPWASGPASAVVVDGHAYLVDFGPGVVRRAAEAYRRGEDALRPDLLDTAFCTHLHTDHTAGFADLIFTPWVLEREKPLGVFGPKGIRNMAQHLLSAYAVDIDFRLHRFGARKRNGYKVEATEIEPGVIYEDERVTVERSPSATAHSKATAISSQQKTGRPLSSAAIPPRLTSSRKRPKLRYSAARGRVCRRHCRARTEVAEISPRGAYAQHGLS